MREGEALSFLLSGRGCCQEEETRKDFLEDAWMNDYGKRRRGLPGRGKNRGRSREAGLGRHPGSLEAFILTELPTQNLRIRLRNQVRSACERSGESG